MPDLTRYYGTDYINAVCVIIAMYLIGNKRRSGFILFMIATACGAVFGVLAGSTPFLISNTILFLTNLRAYLLWRKVSPDAGHLV